MNYLHQVFKQHQQQQRKIQISISTESITLINNLINPQNSKASLMKKSKIQAKSFEISPNKGIILPLEKQLIKLSFKNDTNTSKMYQNSNNHIANLIIKCSYELEYNNQVIIKKQSAHDAQAYILMLKIDINKRQTQQLQIFYQNYNQNYQNKPNLSQKTSNNQISIQNLLKKQNKFTKKQEKVFINVYSKLENRKLRQDFNNFVVGNRQLNYESQQDKIQFHQSIIFDTFNPKKKQQFNGFQSEIRVLNFEKHQFQQVIKPNFKSIQIVILAIISAIFMSLGAKLSQLIL